ncbi:hypothetical protein [Paraburkholderia sp. BCC1886]|uniref:hypothetical protein n=1 Tax=Paraburkholderia sp. BCC1886 TaxID=2562670 RepID=UPI001183F0A8|nr:hypothetical protein [Paraburkholderia sp. BCC1886]
MPRTDKDNYQNIAMMLRDLPLGYTADVSDYIVFYWDGSELAGAHLSPDNPGVVDETFAVEEVLCLVPEVVEDWLKAPTFTFRQSVVAWLSDAPPIDAGV